MYLFDSYISYKVNIFRCFKIFKTSISFLTKEKLSGFFAKDDLLIILMHTLSLVYLDNPKCTWEYSPEEIDSFISYAPMDFGMSAKSFDELFDLVTSLIFNFVKIIFYFSY